MIVVGVHAEGAAERYAEHLQRTAGRCSEARIGGGPRSPGEGRGGQAVRRFRAVQAAREADFARYPGGELLKLLFSGEFPRRCAICVGERGGDAQSKRPPGLAERRGDSGSLQRPDGRRPRGVPRLGRRQAQGSGRQTGENQSLGRFFAGTIAAAGFQESGSHGS